MAKTLIKGGTIVSMDRKVGDFAKGDILVDGDKIEKIGKSIRAPGAKVIDAAGMIVMPGFVNAHLHTWQTGIRGVAGNWSIPEYLHEMHARIAPRYTANDTYLGNLVGAEVVAVDRGRRVRDCVGDPLDLRKSLLLQGANSGGREDGFSS